jgi:hypothetical protein
MQPTFGIDPMAPGALRTQQRPDLNLISPDVLWHGTVLELRGATAEQSGKLTYLRKLAQKAEPRRISS